MATTATTEILASDNRQPSDRLKQAINNCSLGFKKLADAIHEALELGQQEGFSPKEIGKMIRLELRNNNFSDSTIRRYLPAEAKMLSKVRQQVGEFAVNLTAKSDHGLVPKDYQTKNLAKYTKPFLIEIIHYLEQKQATTKSVVHEIKSANTKLSNNNTSRRRTNKHLPKDKIQMIREMREKGMSSRQIFATTGIARTTIARYWK